jgi:hypothetical protein
MTSGIVTSNIGAKMAFDHSLPRGHAHAVSPDVDADSDENAWTLPRTAADVEDKSPGRTSRAYFATHSVTLWDEITPESGRRHNEPEEPLDG